jgi:hypothetical protein
MARVEAHGRRIAPRAATACLLALSLLALAVAFGPTATTAQESERGGIEEGESGSLPSEYRVYRDGTLVIGGDVVVQCRELPRSSRLPSTVPTEDRAATERSHDEAIRACTEAGFPPRWNLGARISGLPGEAKVLLVVVTGAVPLGLVGGLLGLLARGSPR